MITTLIVLGVVVYALMNRCSLLGLCGGGTNENTTGTNTVTSSGGNDEPIADNKVATTPAKAKTPEYKDVEGTITGNTVPAQLLAVTNNNLGPGNFGDEGADEGYGFSRGGGPVHRNGKADDGTGPVGNNKVKGLTIASLPGPCETKPYRGLVQYKHAGLSASADNCTHAKQYFLYKFGLGGGGATAAAVAVKKPTTVKKKKTTSHFSRIAYI